MSYTKGPWVFEDDMGPDIGVYKTYSGEETFVPICSVHTPDIYSTTDALAEEDANAHLIAAAPLMYEFIDMLTHAMALPESVRNKAKEIIAKAEGRE